MTLKESQEKEVGDITKNQKSIKRKDNIFFCKGQEKNPKKKRTDLTLHNPIIF